IMQMDAGLDTGAMLATASCPVGRHTSATLHAELAALGPPLLLETLDHLEAYRSRAQSQDDSAATYAHKIDKREGLVDWHCPAREIERRLRAFDPFPGCYSFLGATRVKIWQASVVHAPTDMAVPGSIVRASDAGIVVACGGDLLCITQLQLPGGKRLEAREVLHGHTTQFTTAGVFRSSPDAAG
ncbi:MAG: methionyl-tRNA formyltransferase, partial [Halioglobus sp.]|nr:methionyl-tRNA formyltransferase [Halioglobus sp.]